MLNHIKKNPVIVGITLAAAFVIIAQFLMLTATLQRLEAKPKAQTGIFLVEDCNTPPRC